MNTVAKSISDNQTKIVVVSSAVYGLGDMATTYAGIHYMGLSERNQIPAMLMHRYGMFGLLLDKILIIGVLLVIWRIMDDRYSAVIPLTLLIIGIIVTAHNVYSMF